MLFLAQSTILLRNLRFMLTGFEKGKFCEKGWQENIIRALTRVHIPEFVLT